MHGWLIRAKQPQSERISCKGQSPLWRLACATRTLHWPLHNIAIAAFVWHIRYGVWQQRGASGGKPYTNEGGWRCPSNGGVCKECCWLVRESLKVKKYPEKAELHGPSALPAGAPLRYYCLIPVDLRRETVYPQVAHGRVAWDLRPGRRFRLAVPYEFRQLPVEP